MTEAWIIDACRTPRGIGKVGKGAVAELHPQVLGATVLRALADRNGLDTRDVDGIVWGTSVQVGAQSGDLGRMAAVDAGYAATASGVTLDRFCGSGITSVNFGGPRHRGHGGCGDRRWDRDDVLLRCHQRSTVAVPRQWQRTPAARSTPRPTRELPLTRSPHWNRSIAALSTSSRQSRNAELKLPSKKDDSRGHLCPCTIWTDRWHWTAINIPARERRSTRWPHSRPRSKPWPTSSSTPMAPPTVPSFSRGFQA